MIKSITLLLLSLCSIAAASGRQSGRVTDSTGVPLTGASVSLLYPEDSTLAVFSISNSMGDFSLPDVKENSYVLQVAVMGYYTEYRKVTVEKGKDADIGTIVLKRNTAANLLDEVVISGEKVPVRVKGDTLEYNAGSYKVKPNAAVEDLLRKLPGVQVDKEGNIKAMGKDVSKVLVDGKEFFGDDPKIATKNLPADAVDKVQAFEKRSDESLFSGIDDGSREQTLNLTLKPGKKSGYFGDVGGGLGVPDHYDATLKAFKFREKSQLAALGMLNNINKFGFTFQDYINFNGGLSNLMKSGGRISMNADEAPVDYGQTVTGKVASGALGLNYTTEPRPNNRLNIAYMGNGIKKFLDQQTASRNFSPDGNFAKNDSLESHTRNLSNRLTLNWRDEIDSVHQVKLSLYAQYGSSKSDETLYSESFQADVLQNDLRNLNAATGNTAEAGGTLGWVKKQKGHWPLIQASLQGYYSLKKEKSRWQNLSHYPASGTEISDNQYQDNDQFKSGLTGNLSLTRSLGKGYYLEPALTANWERDTRNRIQGPLSPDDTRTDSLSPQSYRNVYEIRPGLSLRHSLKKRQWYVALRGEAMWVNPWINGKELYTRDYRYLLPSAFWMRELAAGQRLELRYTTDVAAPSALQLLPATDYSNPLLRTRGNSDLEPEYNHNLNLSYNRFDQFSMSAFFISVNGRYTRNKIDWSRTISPDLSQDLQVVNTSSASRLSLDGQYSRPVRKIGLNINIGLNELWNRTLGPVNGENNINNTLTHQLELSFSNISSDVWDLRWGGNVEISDTKFSLNKQLNNTYYNYTGFARLSYRLGKSWYFGVSGDITHYTAQSFDAPVTVPLLKAEISRYLFANQRGTLTLSGFDLLDKNKAVLRTSQVNYIMEQRSNTIGRYFMLSFVYKLNKVGNPGGGIQVNQR